MFSVGTSLARFARNSSALLGRGDQEGADLRTRCQGQCCHAVIPHGRWKTITFIAGLRLNGIATPALIDEAMNGEILITWVSGVMVRELVPTDVVTIDHLPAHKVACARGAINVITPTKCANDVAACGYAPD